MVVPCVPRTLTSTNVQSYQWKSDDNLPVLNDENHSVDQVNGDLYIRGHISNTKYHCEIIDENGNIHKYAHTTLSKSTKIKNFIDSKYFFLGTL